MPTDKDEGQELSYTPGTREPGRLVVKVVKAYYTPDGRTQFPALPPVVFRSHPSKPWNDKGRLVLAKAEPLHMRSQPFYNEELQAETDEGLVWPTHQLTLDHDQWNDLPEETKLAVIDRELFGILHGPPPRGVHPEVAERHGRNLPDVRDAEKATAQGKLPGTNGINEGDEDE
jgi:hypothetical protein